MEVGLFDTFVASNFNVAAGIPAARLHPSNLGWPGHGSEVNLSL
jgi:hypothetical protein